MEKRKYIEEICNKAKDSSKIIANLSTNEKNDLLNKIANKLREKKRIYYR